MADSPGSSSAGSGNGSPSGRPPKIQLIQLKVVEASLSNKLSTCVEVVFNSEKKRTRIIEGSDLPQWGETFDFSVTDDKWKVTFNLLDAAGKLLGSVAPPRREIDLNLKEVQRFSFGDLAPAITGTASIGIFIQQKDAIGKVNSNPVSELKKSPRPASPNNAKPMLTQSTRSRDFSGNKLKEDPLPPAPAAGHEGLTQSKRRTKKDKDKHEKKEKKDKRDKKDKEKEKKDKLRSSADKLVKTVNIVAPETKETRPRTLSDSGTKKPAAAETKEPETNGPQRDAFLAPTLTQKFKTFGRNSPLVHSWELDSSEVEFQEELGEGASAKVFKGQWRGQEVAIKVMKDRIEPKMLEDFKLEFNIMATIRSPNIVFFYGATLQPILAIVLEYAHKGSLHDAMQSPAEKDSFTWPRSLKILEHALKGILCLHSWKPQIVHRDLKSMNLLVDDNWNVKVGDFGLSRFTGGADQQSTLGKMRGTYAYVAPEVYFGAAFTPKADVYSMAIIMWEVVVRTVTKEYTQPYAEYPQIIFPFQIVIQTAKNNLRPTIPDTVPASLTALIEQGWAKEPEKRPTAQEMLDRVRALTKEYETNKEAWDNPAASTPKPADAATPGGP